MDMDNYLGEVGSIKQDATYEGLMFDFDIDEGHQAQPGCDESRLMSDDLFIADSIQAVLEEPSTITAPLPQNCARMGSTEALLERPSGMPDCGLSRATGSEQQAALEHTRRPRVSEIYDQLDEILSPLSSVTSCDHGGPVVDDRFKLERRQDIPADHERNVRAKLELRPPEQHKVSSPFSEEHESDGVTGVCDAPSLPPTIAAANRSPICNVLRPDVGEQFPEFDNVDITSSVCAHDHPKLEPLPKTLATPDPSFECHVCRKTFTRHCNMIKHKRNAHGIMKDFPCKDCWVSFPNKEGLEKHMHDYHKSKGSFSCPSCGATFSQKFNLNKHVRNVHEKKRPFECGICQQNFQQRDHLNKHVATVHEKQRPFKCPLCEMSFGWLGVLNKHISLIHHKERPFSCEECHSAFQQKAHLEKHSRTVHCKEKPVSCSQCSATFNRRDQLERHCTTSHEKREAVLPPLPPSSVRNAPVRSTLPANSLIHLANSLAPLIPTPLPEDLGVQNSDDFSANPFNEGGCSSLAEEVIMETMR